METTKIVTSRQRLTMTGVAGAEEIEDGLAASKALNESRPRRPRHLMCLVLPSTAAKTQLHALQCVLLSP